MTRYSDIAAHLDTGMESFAEDLPEVMGPFAELVENATSTGALDDTMKEIIALTIAVVVRCEPCIAHHARSAVEAGIDRKQLVEALGVAVLMAGGPAVAYGVKALEAVDQYRETS